MHVTDVSEAPLRPSIHVVSQFGDDTSKPQQLVMIQAEFNSVITGRLANGAAMAAEELGIRTIELWRVAGALEIPVLLHGLCLEHGWSGKSSPLIVTAGCVIRGETDHYQHVCTQSLTGVQQIAVERVLPLGNAILTLENQQQAIDRCLPDKTNKGYEAAMAAFGLWRTLWSISPVPN